jgi:hypothetical protein
MHCQAYVKILLLAAIALPMIVVAQPVPVKQGEGDTEAVEKRAVIGDFCADPKNAWLCVSFAMRFFAIRTFGI